jgi:hypothetical protein
MHQMYMRHARLAARQMHQMYMRHARLAARAVACSNDFEENVGHETDFHARKAEEYRAKAKKARTGGMFSGPNEELAKSHEADGAARREGALSRVPRRGGSLPQEGGD